MKRSQRSAHLTLAKVAAAASVFGGLAGVVPPGMAQTVAYPSDSNTGVPTGTSLTVVNGNMDIRTAGTVIENKDIRGCVQVNASNVTIRKSKISCGGGSVLYNGSSNLLVEDVELVCTAGVGQTALTPANYTARRVNARGCENIFWAQANVLIEDSYIHDTVPYDPVRDPHTDAIQIPTGCNKVTIRHNRVYGGYVNQSNFGNAAITTGHDCADLLIENNVMAGGGYSMRCPEGGTTGSNTNFRVINNRFSRILVSTVGGFGPVGAGACDTPGRITQYSGNVYHETGIPLPGQSVATPSAPTGLTIVP